MSNNKGGGYKFTLVPDNLERRELKLIATSKESASRWTATIRTEIMAMFRDAKIPRVRLNSGYEDISPSQTFKTEKEAHESIKEKYRSRIGGKEQKELGQGQFARVWLVERIKDQKLFACKNFILNDVVSGKSTGGSSRADRMNVLDEIEILKNSDHPNIVKLIDVYIVESKCVYMFLSYCDGGTLEELINKSPSGFLSESQAIAITRELLSAGLVRVVFERENISLLFHFFMFQLYHSLKAPTKTLEESTLNTRSNTGTYTARASVIVISSWKIFWFARKPERRSFRSRLCCAISESQNWDWNPQSSCHSSVAPFSSQHRKFLWYVLHFVKHKLEDYEYSCDIWACGVTVHWMLTGHAPFGHSAMQSKRGEKYIESAIQKRLRVERLRRVRCFVEFRKPQRVSCEVSCV